MYTFFTYSWRLSHIVPKSINYYCCCHYHSCYYSSFGNYEMVYKFIKQNEQKSSGVWFVPEIVWAIGRTRVNWSNELVTHHSGHWSAITTQLMLTRECTLCDKKEKRTRQHKYTRINCPRPHYYFYSRRVSLYIKKKTRIFKRRIIQSVIESKIYI